MRRAFLVCLVLGALVAPGARAVVAVAVTDSTSALGTYTPTSGTAGAQRTTSDPVAFSNTGSTERQLMVFTATFSFVYKANASIATTTVPYQGVTKSLIDVTYASQSSGGSFLPLRIRTDTDLTGGAGWTKNSGCGTITYQGSFSIPYYTNAGASQTALTRYYQVCDSNRIWIDTDKDMSSGADDAWIATIEEPVTTTQAQQELSISSTTYAFTSAGSATTVTLDQGGYLATPIPTATTISLYPLHAMPDGFPAGTDTITITATSYDITQ